MRECTNRERPKGDIHNMTFLLRRSPPAETFAAGAKTTRSKIDESPTKRPDPETRPSLKFLNEQSPKNVGPSKRRPRRWRRLSLCAFSSFEAETLNVARVPANKATIHYCPILAINADIVAARLHTGCVQFPTSSRHTGGIERSTRIGH